MLRTVLLSVSLLVLMLLAFAAWQPARLVKAVDTTAEIAAAGAMTAATAAKRLNLPDPTDAIFVEVAAAAEALLVTGNGRHFPPDGCAGVGILSPAAFLAYWQQQELNA